jgi:hypothetical protein
MVVLIVGISLGGYVLYKFASSAEFVGKFWFWERSKVVI